MTTLRELDLSSMLELVSDKASLQLAQRVVQGEVAFHESRLVQLKQLEQAIGKRVEQMK